MSPRGRQAWGSVRRLSSGRYQARYVVAGKHYQGPTTFATKRAAQSFLAQARADFDRGSWIDPDAARVTLREYATRWLDERQTLRPRTREVYEDLLRLHVLSALGGDELGHLTPPRIRSWHAAMLKAGRPGASTVAKAYRLLHTILGTAVEDGLLHRNPCLVHGAAVERPKERPIATIDEIYALADAITPCFRALVLLATFTGLRLGELRALKRRHLDLLHGQVRVLEQLQELRDGTIVAGPPKTDAGVRTVAIPNVVVAELEVHLGLWSGEGPDGFVFAGIHGQPFRRGTLYTAWRAATRCVGIEGFRFHDLRHTGNTMAAATGASTRELMVRMGHASPRAALLYQHATRERDEAIAAALSAQIEATRTATDNVRTLPGSAAHAR